jgi:Tfp pilus assembly protein PilX
MHFRPPPRPQVGPTLWVTLMMLAVATTLGVGVMTVLQAAHF